MNLQDNNLTNAIQLKEESNYTKFGVNFMGVTTKTEFKLIKIINKNEFLVQLLDKNQKYKKGIYRIKLEHDSFIVEGHTSQHGIYTDSEIKLDDGTICFDGNAELNLVHSDKEKLNNLICFSYRKSDYNDVGNRIRFYQLYKNNDGALKRDSNSIKLADDEIINTPF